MDTLRINLLQYDLYACAARHTPLAPQLPFQAQEVKRTEREIERKRKAKREGHDWKWCEGNPHMKWNHGTNGAINIILIAVPLAVLVLLVVAVLSHAYVLCICDECGSYKHIIYFTVIYAQIIRFIASQFIRVVVSLAIVPRNVVASAMTVFEVLFSLSLFFIKRRLPIVTVFFAFFQLYELYYRRVHSPPT